MKSHILSGIVLALLIALAIAALPSCKSSASFKQSSFLPNAQGFAKAEANKSGSYAVTVRVERLASPEFLTPPKKVYVVWIESKRRGVRNGGVLQIDSNKLGTLTTTAPFKPTRVYITAEDRGDVFMQEGPIVLRSGSL